MLYTLLKFLGWGLLLAIIGGSIGWALRALKCRGELARARRATVDGDEVERMRHRLANLEQVVVERDRLRMQIADMRHTDSPGVVGIAEVATEARVSAPDPELALAPDIDRAEPGDDAEIPAAAEPVIEPGDLDLDAATSVIGTRIRLDDLKVVEGVGPKIAELCSGIGITTWRGLADADVADLQSMLADAGSRYQVHDPTTWPAQARCLADGRWADFVALTSGLSGSR